jgi:hypothetical protein
MVIIKLSSSSNRKGAAIESVAETHVSQGWVSFPQILGANVAFKGDVSRVVLRWMMELSDDVRFISAAAEILPQLTNRQP